MIQGVSTSGVLGRDRQSEQEGFLALKNERGCAGKEEPEGVAPKGRTEWVGHWSTGGGEKIKLEDSRLWMSV